MSSEARSPSGSGQARPFGLSLSIERGSLAQLIEELRRTVREAVREELAAARSQRPEPQPSVPAPANTPQTSRGVELPPDEPIKAKDLRTALLMGKVPEGTGLLIDVGTTASLLGISQRTLHRLIDERAIPAPVRLSGRMLRWRLGELLEWVEAGCPHTNHWKYAPERATPGKKPR